MKMFDLSWPVASLKHMFWTCICSYHLQYTTKRNRRNFVGWVIISIAIDHLGLWTELLGAGGASSGRLPSACCVFLFPGHLLLALGREEVLGWGIFDLTSYSYFYRATAQLCLSWSCRHNSALLFWFKSDVMCSWNKAVMAMQVEKRGGLLIIAAFLEENVRIK